MSVPGVCPQRFLRFLEQRYRSAQAHKETDEVRQALTEAFTREMAAWQEVSPPPIPIRARRAELPRRSPPTGSCRGGGAPAPAG